MCLVIATTFTVTWLPCQLDRLVMVYGNRDDALLVLDALETIAYFNSCVNPIVYALMWRPFRVAFIQVMRRTFHHDQLQWRRQLCGTGARTPPRLPTISFLVDSEVNLRANYPSIV